MPTKRTVTPPPTPAPARPPYMLIEQIQVKGYKSLVDVTLHVRPLTLLAGTNSSGKSSVMQPLLLIKQTMEAPYQPAGALLLEGAHVQAETAGELVSKVNKSNSQFIISVLGRDIELVSIRDILFEQAYSINGTSFQIDYQKTRVGNDTSILTPNMTKEKIDQLLIFTKDDVSIIGSKISQGEVFYDGCFLRIQMRNEKGQTKGRILYSHQFEEELERLMHIPGLRGAPKRGYPSAFFEYQIRGTFDLYAAGTVNQWQQQNNIEALSQLSDYLQRLGLTNSISAKVKNANEVELSVNRLPASSKSKPKKADMVNIADVGIGVSQVLPILVALIAAQEGQIVYVEQPELHLHPRAQVAMGELLAEAANRGVRVIVETHSSLLLLTVQTLIAQGKIANTDVGLHWFTRDAKGVTNVQYVVPDEDGAYGEWPEDFSDIELKAQDAYLTAVGLRQFGEAAQ
ncbi:MAG: AAA family ATPase [Janthinobacterium lividum]